MILRSEDLKRVCTDILAAVDSSELTAVTETLELKTEEQNLLMSVTNRQYYVQVKLDLGEEIDLHATVNASQFLKLISQTTTDTIEFTATDKALTVKGNGTYKLPLIYENDQLLKIPEILINNKTVEFNIDGSILTGILFYNSKQLPSGALKKLVKPVQNMYYVDEQGAITFTTGACVNTFTLDKPVRMLLDSKLVKLFKLFRDTNVHFTLGYDPDEDGRINTKVKFESSDVAITAILNCNDSMLNSVPVASIRERATNPYSYSVNFNKEALLQMVNRLLLFSNTDSIVSYSIFEFQANQVVAYDVTKENKETLYYSNENSGITNPYIATLDLKDLKNTLDTCNEQYITVKFGDGQAVVIGRGTVCNVLPELH